METVQERLGREAWPVPSSARRGPGGGHRQGGGGGPGRAVPTLEPGAATRLQAQFFPLLAEGLGAEESSTEESVWPDGQQPWPAELDMLEAEDLTQLRLLNLQLLRQLWAGQDAVRRSVARATLASSLDSSSSCNSTGPLSPETTTSSSTSSFSASPPDTQQGDPSDVASCGRLSSRVTTLPPAKGQHQASQGQLRSHSAPLLPVANFKDSEPSAGQGDLGSQQTQAPRPILPRQRKSRVTFCTEPKVPGSSWRLRPYLGYDWIAESLDSCSPITSKPEAFFSTLQKFREAHRKECTSSSSEPGLGVHESDGEEGDHECVFCYRVNRRLFLVPSDPGTPCRLCGTPREQQGPETLQEPAQVRVSVPLSVLDPPHRYHIHRRKSFDASDTLSLPRHCLLGWDILPPKPEKGSTPKSLDLWSSMSSTAHHRKLCTASPARLVLPPRDPAPTPIWSHPRLPQPHAALRIQP